MNIRRALIAAGMQVVITILVTTIIVTVYITMLNVQQRGPLPEAEMQMIGELLGQSAGIVVGVIAAFFAGWWGARGLGAQAIRQGLLIGAVIAVVGVVIDLIGGDVGALTAVAVLLLLAAATAGAFLARSPESRVAP